MAVKIIEEPPESYSSGCPKCGARFTYELGDISATGVVYCPSCGERCYHRDQRVIRCWGRR